MWCFIYSNIYPLVIKFSRINTTDQIEINRNGKEM